MLDEGINRKFNLRTGGYKMDTSDLAKRMKEYEKVSRRYLMRRQPVILRLDMRAGHTFCRGFKRPFDEVFIRSMQETAKYLCENIMGAVLSYQQSDEITIVLIDYKKLNSQAWFDNCQNKIESIAASMATMAFNKAFARNVRKYEIEDMCSLSPQCVEIQQKHKEYIDTLRRALDKGAMFDARCFNIPKEEVTNSIYWRQLDASRNSIQMVGQANFSHKELQNKSCNDIQDMLMTQKGINWNDLLTYQKRGSCCIKEEYFEPCENGKQVKYEEGCSNPMEDDCKSGVYRTRWIIDKDIPIFRGDGRGYIDRLVNVCEE